MYLLTPVERRVRRGLRGERLVTASGPGRNPVSGSMTAPRLRILGIGGSFREGSSTEQALAYCLGQAKGLGADIQMLGGEFLSGLPIFDPRPDKDTGAQHELVRAVRQADGIILATPGYHGSLSGLIKNALDTLELGRDGPAPYFQDRPVGVVVTCDGSQAAGTTLVSLRSIIHAMRGWPTPYGAAVTATPNLFDEGGRCSDAKNAWQLQTVTTQVIEFARMRSALAAILSLEEAGG
jgi:FMN reductase